MLKVTQLGSGRDSVQGHPVKVGPFWFDSELYLQGHKKSMSK